MLKPEFTIRKTQKGTLSPTFWALIAKGKRVAGAAAKGS